VPGREVSKEARQLAELERLAGAREGSNSGGGRESKYP